MKQYFCSIFALLSLSAFAQQPLSIETMLNMKRVGTPVTSTDGVAMCFTIETQSIEKNKGNKDLYLTYTSYENIEPVQLTNSEASEYSPQFNKIGSHIYYLSNEGGAPQVWVMDNTGQNKFQITSVQDGIGSFVISQDETTLFYTTDVKIDKTINEMYPDAPKSTARVTDDLMYRHWDSWDDFSNTHLFYTKVKNYIAESKAVDIMATEPYDVESFSVAPDGKGVAYSCKKLKGKEFALSTNTDIYFYEIDGKVSLNVSKGLMGYDMNPVFSHTGKYIAWESMKTPGFESDKATIMLLDLGTAKYTDINANFGESASNLTWSADDKSLYFISPLKGTYQIFEMIMGDKVVVQLTEGDHDYHSIALGAKALVGAKTTMTMPQEIFNYNLTNNKENQVTFTNKKVLEKLAEGKAEKRIVKTTDGKDMLVWIIYPPNFDATKKYPTLLYCQGGPQSMVSCSYSFRWNFQLMAANGYIIVAPNRRGLPGFGREWNDAISGDWGGQPMKDYLSAIDDAVKIPGVDATRLGAVGASYGGYSVYWLAGNHNKRFKSFIAHCGLFNLDSWYPSTDEMFFANQDIGGAPWKPELADKYGKFSPSKFVKNWNTPIMVIHGEKDFRVPVSEGMQAFGTAQLMNIKSRFLYFPDEGHWVLKPQNALVWHREFYRWLKETL